MHILIEPKIIKTLKMLFSCAHLPYIPVRINVLKSVKL